LQTALATWHAWLYYKTVVGPEIGRILLTPSQLQALDRVVANLFDLAPVTNNRWREGAQWKIWRDLATQMATGKVKPPRPGIALPLESMLLTPPLEVQSSDIPLHFVGSGYVADSLIKHLSLFAVPSRLELQQALLTVFRYEQVSGRSSDQHERYEGGGNKFLLLPKRNPVGRHVFHALLRHFKISPQDYAKKIRPQIGSVAIQ
jgi:hypothetical protein